MIEDLYNYFSKLDFIDFALLFGSYSNGKQNALSDLDIGIHTNKDLELIEMGKILADLEKIVDIEIDLSILNEVYHKNSTFAHNVTCNHKIIFCRDNSIYVNFKTNSFIYYFDDEPLRKMVLESFKKRVKLNRIGDSNFVG